MKLARLALVLALFSSRCLLAQWEVPGTHATVQEAIDAASDDDVIVVHGGTWTSILIDKPLTLIGDPAPTFENYNSGDDNDHQYACIRLAGHGSGRVTLVNIVATGGAASDLWATAGGGIDGGGFEALHLLSSSIGPFYVSPGDEEIGAAPGIQAGVGFIIVERSTVIGGDAVLDSYVPVSSWVHGGTGVVGSTVVVLDSTVTGGKCKNGTYVDGPYPCPTTCDEVAGVMGGTGGDGVSADVLMYSNASFAGGQGATLNFLDCSFICKKADGVGVVANVVKELPNTLTGSGLLKMGQAWTFAWSSDAPVAYLLVSTHVTEPLELGSKGSLFPETGSLLISPVAGGGTFFSSATVPVDAALTGVEVGLQVFDPANGLSRPVISCIVP